MLYIWFDDEEECYCYEVVYYVCKYYVGEGYDVDFFVGFGV